MKLFCVTVENATLFGVDITVLSHTCRTASEQVVAKIRTKFFK